MMSKEERLRLLLEDERVRELELRNRLMMINQVIDSAPFPQDVVDDDFQHALVELGEEEEVVYELDVPSNKAFIAEYIGNDWYPGIEYKLFVDDDTILGTIEREIAPTNDPTKVRFLARETVRWEASNNNDDATEDRNLGVVTGGSFIPAEVYDELHNITRQMGGITTNPAEPELLEFPEE